jgi:hypothetical protein
LCFSLFRLSVYLLASIHLFFHPLLVLSPILPEIKPSQATPPARCCIFSRDQSQRPPLSVRGFCAPPKERGVQ